QKTDDYRLLLLLPRGESLEIAVDLLLIRGRRLIIRARGQPVLGVAFLKLLRQRRLDLLQRRTHLSFHLLPLRTILLERFCAGRRQRHALPLERGPGSALCIARILAAHLVHEFAHFLHLAIELFADLSNIDTRSARPTLPLTDRGAFVPG